MAAFDRIISRYFQTMQEVRAQSQDQNIDSYDCFFILSYGSHMFQDMVEAR